MDINRNTATGSGFGKLNFTGLFLSAIHLEFVIIERLSAPIVDSGLGLLEKSKMEEWPSGRWRHLGKVVKGNLPWVRIPLLPPYRGVV